MPRKLKYDIPGPDWRRSPQQIREVGVAALFDAGPSPEARVPLVVELGFGRGEFLLALAESAPERRHLGVEISFKRVLKLARRTAVTELRNVRLLCERAEVVVGELLEPGSVDEFWINFPDPWPKKRHAKNRLVQPPFVAALSRCLVPGGVAHFATDDRAYAEQMDEVLAAEASLENLNAPAHWLPETRGRLHTAYEAEWRAEGRPLHFFEYGRR